MTTAHIDNFKTSRRRLLILLTLVVLLAAMVFAVYWLHYGRYHVSTDDAYVSGNRDAVTAQVPGIVTTVEAQNTDYVQRGAIMVQLDTTDTDIALAAAEAQLAAAVRTTRGAVLDLTTLAARLSAAAAAQTQAQRNDRRAQQLFRGGAIARAQLEEANVALTAAQARQTAARASLARAKALVRSGNPDRAPAVLAAEAAVRRAYVARSRCILRAPVSGYVAQRSVALGQQVRAGQVLLTVIPLGQVWVTANFKEPQLRAIRIGERVRLTSDWYGSHVVYRGRIAGLGAGSGSAFSLLPPENASGNWIKIVQRVPVRIALPPQELAQHPLRIGLSMSAVVTTGPRRSREHPEPARTHDHTSVYSGAALRAAQLIARIVRSNSGPPAHLP